MKPTPHSDGEHRGWPGHLLWGRVRTSTAVLLIAFFGSAWLYETYQPPAPAEQSTQVVPPGFVPDPAYTWVPRTKVWTTTPETPRPETTTPTETGTPGETPTETTEPTESTTPGETPTTIGPAPTTGPTPTAPAPTTLAPGQTPQTTAENRSGAPAAPGTTPASGPATAPATPRGPG